MTTLFTYLENLIKYRLAKELNQQDTPIPALDIEGNTSNLAKFIKNKKLKNEDIVLLLLALVPKLEPGFLSSILSEERTTEESYLQVKPFSIS
jgi:hypothetical protein